MDVASISALVAASGVIVGVVFTVMELRNLVKTRQTDLVMRLYSTFGSREFQEDWMKGYSWKFKDYNDFVEKYASEARIENWVTLFTFLSFFEGIGVLLRRKLIDIELVVDFFDTQIKMTWEKTKPLVEGLRKRYENPKVWEYIEYAYNELNKREQMLQAPQ